MGGLIQFLSPVILFFEQFYWLFEVIGWCSGAIMFAMFWDIVTDTI